MTENGILKYPEVMDKLSNKFLPLVENYCLPILEKVHELFKIQEQSGFYPPRMNKEMFLAAASKNPTLLSPYKLVRWHRFGLPGLSLKEEKLQAVDYTEDAATKKTAAEIMSRMEEMMSYIQSQDLPQRKLMAASLAPQIKAWKLGKFEEAMFEHINMRHLPNLNLLALLFDRYLDPWGIHYAAQGWVLNRNNDLTEDYNRILKGVLSGSGEEEKHRVVVGDALAFAGLAARRGGWSGNTLPSEDSLRKDIGSTSYIFYDHFCRRFERDFKPALLKYTPEVAKIEGWQYKAKRAGIISLILHESYGHTQIPFDETTIEILQEDYAAEKERACDILTHAVVLDLPNRLASDEIKRLVVDFSLAWGGVDNEDYLKETDPIKKQTLEAYAKAATGIQNYYGCRGDIRVNDKGEITILDLNSLKQSAKLFKYGLEQAMKDERNQRGSLRKFFQQSVGKFNGSCSGICPI